MNRDWTTEFRAWQDFAQRVRRRADRIRCMLDADARQTARRAGLAPDICYLHAHNAIAYRIPGKPWAEVDYALARRVLWLEERQFLASSIAERVICRAYNRFAAKYNSALYEVRP